MYKGDRVMTAGKNFNKAKSPEFSVLLSCEGERQGVECVAAQRADTVRRHEEEGREDRLCMLRN